MGVLWSPDFDDYVSGRKTASEIRCALCGLCPCACPEFGTMEYFALVDYRHGRTGGILPPILTEFFVQRKG